MDCARAGGFRRGNDRLAVQITLRRRRGSDRYGTVGHRDVARVRIGFGIDRDGLQAHRPRRLNDPAGDLASVGDEKGLEAHDCGSSSRETWSGNGQAS